MSTEMVHLLGFSSYFSHVTLNKFYDSFALVNIFDLLSCWGMIKYFLQLWQSLMDELGKASLEGIRLETLKCSRPISLILLHLQLIPRQTSASYKVNIDINNTRNLVYFWLACYQYIWTKIQEEKVFIDILDIILDPTK